MLNSTRLSILSRTILSIVATLTLVGASRAQVLDSNANGMSDVWEIVNNAQGIDPDLDSDGDGVPNRLEAIAGTNPFDKHSLPLILPMSVTSNGVVVTMDGALGKRYELQASEVVCGSMATNWFVESSLIARTNTKIVLIAPANLQMKFFRIAISDVDTDGDGLSDWEEYQLGLDPFSPNSNPGVGADGKPLTDLQFAGHLLAASMAKQQSPGANVANRTANDTLIIYPKSAPTGTGLTGNYFTNCSATYTNSLNFNPTNLFLTTNDAAIDFRWGSATT
jgi:hypothetical protein